VGAADRTREVCGPAGVAGPRLGMHVSIAGGMDRMAERARVYGCETAQVFSRSPRGGRARDLGPDEVSRARGILTAAGVSPLVVHSPYFVNLVSADESLRAYAVETLIGETERAALLGAPYVVTHLGRRPEEVGPAQAVATALQSVRRVLESASDGVMLLLENTAGVKREIGASLEELAGLVSSLEEDFAGRVGICLDTCHAHAAGYDLSSSEAVSRFTRLAAGLFGPERVKVFHVNDSLGEVSSHVDRHAAIGSGTIGLEGFRTLLSDPIFRGCPFILETPGSDDERAADLERLRRLREDIEQS